MAKIKRVPKNQAILNPNDIISIAHNVRAGGYKNVIVGAEIRKQSLSGLSAIDASTVKKIAPGTSLAIFNNSSLLAWVTMNKSTDGAPTPPTGLANGFPLKPNEWTYLNMGENDQILTSAATVGIYIIEDDTHFQVIPDEAAF